MSYNYQKECREAIDAGNRALDSLKDAKACLDSARNWGIFDMLGGGLLSGLIKRSKINDAQNLMRQARQDLQSFSRELGDVHMSGEMDVEINDFIGFADLLWDNFLVDWMMQDRINNARSQVDEVIGRVEQIVSRLQYESVR
ncbi:MAG: hypothetical protein IJ106_13655 [Parasporobacterium sp.]|nr:hypothetical protein [Parasporobacterium sp.]